MIENKSFSQRHGFGHDAIEPLIYDDAPDSIRVGLLSIIRNFHGLSSEKIIDIVYAELGVYPNEWCEDHTFNDQLHAVMRGTLWYKIYDIMERFYQVIKQKDELGLSDGEGREYQNSINRLLSRNNIGWEMLDGILQARTDESGKQLFQISQKDLAGAGMNDSARELREAIADISRRPDPDLTGAISHAMNAMEAVAKEKTSESQKSFGKIIKAHPELFPSPMGRVSEMMWGYASNTARHGNEGNKTSYEEAFLIVGIASALCSYLVNKMPQSAAN